MRALRTRVLVQFLAVLGACSTPHGAEPAASPSCSSARAPSPPAKREEDPFAPVVVPGSDRPRAMHSVVLAGIGRVTSAAAFRAASGEHPQGTLLLGVASPGSAELTEVDIASGSVARRQRLPLAGSAVRVAATSVGVVVAVGDGGGESDAESVFVLDEALKIQATRKIHGWGTSVHAAGSLAIVGNEAPGSDAAELTTLELPSGKLLGRRHVASALADEWVPAAQVLVHGDRVFALARGREHYVLQAFSSDLARKLGEAKMPGSQSLTDGPCASPGPHHGDGTLAWTPDGLLVVREGSLDRYDSDLNPGQPIPSALAHFPQSPAIDPASKRLLFATGDAAQSSAARRTEPVVAFRRDLWKWSGDGEVPLYYDEPVAAFFLSERGVIVTRHPELRITVLEWR